MKWISTARWRYISTLKKFSALCWGQIATVVVLILLILPLFLLFDFFFSCELTVRPVLNWDVFLPKVKVTKTFSLDIFYCNSIKPIKFSEVKLHLCVGYYCIASIHQVCTNYTPAHIYKLSHSSKVWLLFSLVWLITLKRNHWHQLF